VQTLKGKALAGNANNGFQRMLDILLVRHPGRHADPHSGSAFPDRAAAPACPILLYASDHLLRHFFRTKGDQHLIDDHIIQYFKSGVTQTSGERLGMRTRPLNQIA
jgi:hypothetical protein